jgi:hypothetical protein
MLFCIITVLTEMPEKLSAAVVNLTTYHISGRTSLEQSAVKCHFFTISGSVQAKSED